MSRRIVSDLFANDNHINNNTNNNTNNNNNMNELWFKINELIQSPSYGFNGNSVQKGQRAQRLFSTGSSSEEEIGASHLHLSPICKTEWPNAIGDNGTSAFWSLFNNHIKTDIAKNEFDHNGIEVPLNNENNHYRGYEMFGSNCFRFACKSESGSYGSSPPPSPPPVTYMQPKIRRRPKTQTFCVFCKNNNETPEIYKNHILKDPEGKIMCPVLRKYNCPICGNNGGDKAHTIRYCPKNRAGESMPSVMRVLKNGRSSDGKKRAH